MEQEIRAIDINLNEVKSKGVAYYRLTKDMKEFLDKCLEENDIVGFEWEKGSFNFGIILADKKIINKNIYDSISRNKFKKS